MANHRANFLTSWVMALRLLAAKSWAARYWPKRRCLVLTDRDAVENIIARILHGLSPEIRHKCDTPTGLYWADNDNYRPTLSARILTPQMQENRPDNLGLIDACDPLREHFLDRRTDLGGGHTGQAEGLQRLNEFGVLLGFRCRGSWPVVALASASVGRRLA